MIEERQACPWCALKECARPKAMEDVLLSQGQLFVAYVECSACRARGPQALAIGRDAAISAAQGRWSEVISWMKATSYTLPSRS